MVRCGGRRGSAVGLQSQHARKSTVSGSTWCSQYSPCGIALIPPLLARCRDVQLTRERRRLDRGEDGLDVFKDKVVWRWRPNTVEVPGAVRVKGLLDLGRLVMGEHAGPRAANHFNQSFMVPTLAPGTLLFYPLLWGLQKT